MVIVVEAAGRNTSAFGKQRAVGWVLSSFSPFLSSIGITSHRPKINISGNTALAHPKGVYMVILKLIKLSMDFSYNK